MKICLRCKKSFLRPTRIATTVWLKRKYCSIHCCFPNELHGKERIAQTRHEWRRKRYQELMEQVNRLKCSPCMDCKKTYNPWQMDFDHRNPDEKVRAIASLINVCCSERILQLELAKCDLLCSNCHRNRTYLRKRGLYHGQLSY